MIPSTPLACTLVPYPERRRQVHLISTLPQEQLIRMLLATPILATAAQERLLSRSHALKGILAGHAHLREHVQDVLAVEPSQYIRRCLAENPALVASAAELLYAPSRTSETAHGGHYVVTRLAANPATPHALLEEICAHESAGQRDIHHALLSNPSIRLDRWGRIEELRNDEQWVVAKRADLPLSEFLRLRLRNIHSSHLWHRLFDHPLLTPTLALQQGWEGTLGELLAFLERTLTPLTPVERESVLGMYPTWEGKWSDLLTAVRSLNTLHASA